MESLGGVEPPSSTYGISFRKRGRYSDKYGAAGEDRTHIYPIILTRLEDEGNTAAKKTLVRPEGIEPSPTG